MCYPSTFVSRTSNRSKFFKLLGTTLDDILMLKMVLASQPKSRQNIHDRKRSGLHHKPTKHYTKTYWPYLPMLLIVVAGLILNATWNVGKNVLGYATSVSPTSLLSETNIQRSQNGLGSLTQNNQLAQAAQAKANDMVARDYWSHTNPDGKQPWQFISDSGYTFSAAGENLAYGFDSSSATVSGWMNSPSHRANVLNTNYQEVGFGIANSSNFQDTGEETIVVAMYAKPQAVVAPSTVTNGRAPVTTPVPAKKTTPAPAETTPTPVATTPVAEQPVATEPTKAADATNEESPVSVPTPEVKELKARQVSRIDVLTDGNAQWAALAMSVLASLAILTFVLRHAAMWKRYLIKGETFFIKHPVLDTVFVAVGVLGFLLTRTSGFIH